MKNRLIKYILTSLFIFFVVSGVTNAEEQSISVPLDGSNEFIHGTSFSGVDCGEGEDGILELTYFIVTETSGGSYKVRLKDKVDASSGTENLTCTYKTRYGMVGNTRKLLDRDGSVSFTFNFTTTIQDTTINATMSRNTHKLDIGQYLPSFSSVKKDSVVLTENENRLDILCSDNQCLFQKKDDTFNGQSYYVKGNFVYIASNGQEANVTFNIYVDTSYFVKASAGEYGVCDFDGNWEIDENSANAYKLKYNYNGSIVLPNCDASKSKAPVKFYGWVYTNSDDSTNDGQNVMVSNVCKNYPKAEGDIKGLIDSGVGRFYTCYETIGSLYLNPAGGVVNVQDSWQEQNGKYLIVQENDFILPEITQFPSYLKSDENNKVSYYWQASNDRSKKYKAGDSVKPNGQTFTAIYETETFIETELYEYNVMYVRDKQLYALSTVKFDTCSTNSPNLVTVSLDPETGGCMMEAKEVTSEDQTIEVYGYNTEKDQTYTLNLRILSRNGTTEGGDEEFVIKFDEYAIAGYGQTGEIEPTPVKPAPYEPGTPDIDSIANPSCESYRIKTLYADDNPYASAVAYMTPATSIIKPDNDDNPYNDGHVRKPVTIKTPLEIVAYDPQAAGASGNGIIILHNDSFRADCEDTTQDENYPTVCLDPSAEAPDENAIFVEKKPEDIEIDDAVINFLRYVIQNDRYQSRLVETYSEDVKDRGPANHPKDIANIERVSVTFVARLLGAGGEKGLILPDGANQDLISYYWGFKYLADKKETFIDDSRILWTPDAQYQNPNNYKTTIRELMKVVNSGKIGKINDKNNPNSIFVHETKQRNVETEINGNVVTFRGELILPDDINNLGPSKVTDFQKQGDNVKAKMVCANNLKCEIKDIYEVGMDSENNALIYKFEFDVEFNEPADLSNNDNVRMYLYFKSYKDKHSLVFLADHAVNNKVQRMVIFKDEQSYMFRYGGEPNVSVCNLGDFPKTPSEFTEQDEQDFINKNCCQLITNRNDPRYQSYCGDPCTKVTYSIACDTKLTPDPNNPTANGKYEVYTINEGVDKVNGSEQIGACIVDVEKANRNADNHRKSTETITDAVGNVLALSSYKDNDYCRVSCKEDWNLKTPGFKNFVGAEGAVKAGQYFRLNEEIFLGGTRTCYTTYIDYQHYHDDIKILSGKMAAAYNTYAEAKKAYESAKTDFVVNKYFKEYDDNGNLQTSTSNPVTKENAYIVGYKQALKDGYKIRKVCRVEGEDDKELGLYENDEDYEKSLLEAAETGDGETGDGETGDEETGDEETGDEETGDEEEKDACDGEIIKQYYYIPDVRSCAIYNVHVPAGVSVPFHKKTGDFGDTTKSTNGKHYSTSATYGTEDSDWIDAPENAEELPDYDASSLGICESESLIKNNDLDSLDPNDSNFLSKFFDVLIDKITDYQSQNIETTFNYSSLDHGRYDGSIDANDDVYGYHKGTLEVIMNTAAANINVYRDKLKEKVTEMGACQNFYMYNNIKEDSKNNYFYNKTETEIVAYGNKGNGYGYKTNGSSLKVDNIKIPTPFDPDIRYQYEEYEFMTLVGDKNYLVPDANENDELFKNNNKDKNGNCVPTGMKDNNGKDIQLCVNKLDTYGYNAPEGWENSKIEGKTYGVNDEAFDINKAEIANESMIICTYDGKNSVNCENGNFYYYKVNYIKQSLSNGGYFRNYGDFYVSQYSDVKIFAPSLEEARKQANVAGSTDNDWGPLGGNSFPIGLDTRRNIYQYMYSFGNIGIYNDTNTSLDLKTDNTVMGRVIGGYNTGTNTSTDRGGESLNTGKPAIVAEHTHACFYEVFEELCICCGLPINSTVASPSMPSKIENTEEFLINNGYTYKFSNDNDSSGGVLGFYTSTISLYDLDGKPGNDVLKGNWSDDDSFRVYGNTYSTDKGGQLADAIVSVGEEIYNREPEYSYTLDPAAMAEIRDYNELNGYEHSIRTMRNVATCAIASDSSDCTNVLKSNDEHYTEDNTMVFVHYGSRFLEDIDRRYTTEGYRNLSTRHDICSISSGELGSDDTYIDMKNGRFDNCRWVDYVMKKDESPILKGDDGIAEMADVTHFRLAFK